MNGTKPESTIELDVTVDVPVAHAFRVFTERFDRIKPREYNLLSSDIAETVFETRAGGHVYDRGVDGSVCRWARVLVFEPPHRFVISWDITQDWRPETDPDKTSEVEVRFIELGPEKTRVELEHRGIERHGDRWREYRDEIAAGWPVFLGRFTELAA